MPYAFVPARNGFAYTTDAITGFPGGNVVQAGTATHQTDGAVPGDAIAITGSTSNDGDYIVLDVQNETDLEVYPPLTAEAAAGNVAVYQPAHQLNITDEATISCTSIATAMAALDARIFQRVMSMNANFVANNNNPYDFYRSLIQNFNIIHTGATRTTWSSTREVLVNAWERAPVTVANNPQRDRSFIGPPAAGDPGEFVLEFGELAVPSDPNSWRNASHIFGYGFRNVPSASWAYRVYGGFIGGSWNTVPAYIGSNISGEEGALVHTNIDGGISLVGDQPLRIRNSSASSISSWASPFILNNSGVVDYDGLVIGDTVSGGFAFFADIEIPGLTLSDGANSPIMTVFAGSVLLDNPGEDAPLSSFMSLFANAGVGSTGAKQYTFNPRFVDVSGAPIQNLSVTLEQKTDFQYVEFTTGSASTWTITINGTDIPFTPGSASIADARSAAVTAINASSEPVTASTNLSTSNQMGTDTNFIVVYADTNDDGLEIVATTAGAGGAWEVNPLPASGPASTINSDYRPRELTGSPFTSDANGRINTDGVLALREWNMEVVGSAQNANPINSKLLVTVEGAGYATTRFFFVPEAPFAGDFTIPYDSMGGVR